MARSWRRRRRRLRWSRRRGRCRRRGCLGLRRLGRGGRRGAVGQRALSRLGEQPLLQLQHLLCGHPAGVGPRRLLLLLRLALLLLLRLPLFQGYDNKEEREVSSAFTKNNKGKGGRGHQPPLSPTRRAPAVSSAR